MPVESESLAGGRLLESDTWLSESELPETERVTATVTPTTASKATAPSAHFQPLPCFGGGPGGGHGLTGGGVHADCGWYGPPGDGGGGCVMGGLRCVRFQNRSQADPGRQARHAVARHWFRGRRGIGAVSRSFSRGFGMAATVGLGRQSSPRIIVRSFASVRLITKSWRSWL